MATTTNYGWTTPDDTALVKDGAAAIRTLGSSVDTTTKALNPETTLGDLAYRSSTANVKTRLGLGTAGQVLQVNSGATAPEWATASSGGMTLISTTTLNGTPTVVLSSIPQTYNNLYIVIKNNKPVNDGIALYMRFNNDSTASRHLTLISSSGSNNGNTATTFNATLSELVQNDNSVANGLSIIEIFDYTNTTTWKSARVVSLGVNDTTTTSANLMQAMWAYNQTSAITSLGFLNGSGNMTSGTLLLYGVK
jgi:hypothetical protein